MGEGGLLSGRVARTLSRRRLLEHLSQGAVAGGLVSALLPEAGCDRARPTPPPKPARTRTPGKVGHRRLGRTGLSVSELGFGGHSWSYDRVPEGSGLRKVTIDEATRMIATAIDMGVNYFDSCSPVEEHTVPGEAIKRLKKRDQIVVCARCLFKSPEAKTMGTEADKKRLFAFVDERLKMWQTDHFDILMASTTLSDSWDLSYCLEAFEELKKRGKIRFSGFGSHFTPETFTATIERFGRVLDMCSMPYNVRERAAERIMPVAKAAGLGVVTIKPFARGSLLKDIDLSGEGASLPRDMIAAILENELPDVCVCGVHTEAQMRENFSGAWTTLSEPSRERLERFRSPLAYAPHDEHRWLEHWRYA